MDKQRHTIEAIKARYANPREMMKKVGYATISQAITEDIPDLLTEVDQLTAQVCKLEKDLDEADKDNITLGKRAEAAKRDMRTYIERNVLETSGKYACDLCANGGDFDDWSGKECPEGCNGISNWQWRGPANTKGGQGDEG
jgi:hypothetical protein